MISLESTLTSFVTSARPNIYTIELMCCDYCRTVYHPKCHPEQSSTSEVEGFRCQECEASNRTRRVACGKCIACKRENDCETCVICVNNIMNDGKSRSKCIFRRCQGWGKNVYKEEESDEDEGSDHHDSSCHTCGDGGGKFVDRLVR